MCLRTLELETDHVLLYRSGINKPVAVEDWLTRTNPQEEHILILDADMIILKPFDPIKMGVAPGIDCLHPAHVMFLLTSRC